MNSLLISGKQGVRGFVAVGGLAAILTASPAAGMSDHRGNLPHGRSVTNGQTGSAGVESPAVVVAQAGKNRPAKENGLYDPAFVYSGMFQSEQIYKIVVGPETWAGSRRPARSKDITCRDARTALERRGTWTGALTADGACGSGEPTVWALGNFLNFQTGLEDAESDR